MKVSYAVVALLGGMMHSVDAQYDAKKCETYLDCPSTLCCGTATPQVSLYGQVHKICFTPTKNIYMNFNGYMFDFACDPINVDNGDNDNEPDKPFDKGNNLDEYNASVEKYESRFWDDYEHTDPENIAGYGVNKPW